MKNIITLYRFNTPFLDLNKEKKGLFTIIDKIEKSLKFDSINFNKINTKDKNYHKINLNFLNYPGKIEIFYISEINKMDYSYPIFKLNVFVGEEKLQHISTKINIINFLSNIFECFDGLNEKEFLIDIDKDLFYKKFFKKFYPNHDFSSIKNIKKEFEDKNGEKLINDFILKFTDKNFVLTKENSDYYHKLHSIILYFIYLVFLMRQNIELSNKTKNSINKNTSNEFLLGHIDLMEKRLNFIQDLQQETYESYKNRLDLFFKMF